MLLRSQRRLVSLVSVVAIAAATLLVGVSPAQAADYTVSGVVTDDSLSAVDGASVSFWDGVNQYETTTGADGAYSIVLPEGPYTEFTVSASGYESHVQYGFQMTADTVADVVLTTDPVLVDVSGVITDASGDPVSMWFDVTSDSSMEFVESNASGAYSVALYPGDYTVFVSDEALPVTVPETTDPYQFNIQLARDFGSITGEIRYSDGSLADDAEFLVRADRTCEGGDLGCEVQDRAYTSDGTFALSALDLGASFIVSASTESKSFIGLVESVESANGAGAHVVVTVHAPASITGTTSRGTGPAQVDQIEAYFAEVEYDQSTHEYAINFLLPGSYAVSFGRGSGYSSLFQRASGYSMETSEQFYGGSRTEDGAEPVVLTEGETATGINPTLDAATFAGIVVDAEGVPVIPDTVTALTPDDSLQARAGDVATDGTFTIPGLTDGDYQIVLWFFENEICVEDPNTGNIDCHVEPREDGIEPGAYYYTGPLAGGVTSYASMTEAEATELQAVVPSTTAAGTIVIGGVAPPPGPGAIGGTVTGDGDALEGIEVSACGATDATDANGNYLLEGIDAGTCDVAFHDPSGDFQDETAQDVAVVADQTTDLDADLEPTVVPPPSPGAIGGTVTGDGDALEGIEVHICDQREMVTDAEGKYLIPDLDAGEYCVAFHDLSGEYQDKTVEGVVVNPDNTTPLNVALVPVGAEAGVIDGSVTNEGGDPLEGIEVTACGEAAETDADGAYLIDGLAAGSCDVALHDPAGHYQDKTVADVDVEAGETTTVDVELDGVMSSPGSISGTVTDEDGNPLSGIKVVVGGQTVSTDAEGAFSVGGLLPSLYGLTATDPDGLFGATVLNGIQVVAGEDTEVTVVMAAGPPPPCQPGQRLMDDCLHGDPFPPHPPHGDKGDLPDAGGPSLALAGLGALMVAVGVGGLRLRALSRR